MTISDEAVEAAAKAAAKDEDASNWHDESEYYRNGWRNRMQVGIEAAAAFIRAQALEDAADDLPFLNRPKNMLVRQQDAAHWLRDRAAEMREDT